MGNLEYLVRNKSEHLIELINEAKRKKGMSNLALPDLIQGTMDYEDSVESKKSRLDIFKDVKLSSISFVYVSKKGLFASAVAFGNNGDYPCIIVFEPEKISISDTKDRKHPIEAKSRETFSAKGGDTIYLNKINWKHPVVSVRCSCMDFRFSFSWPNSFEGALWGKRIKYKRKTDTYPSRNPENIPGLCKHLVALAYKLKDSKFTT